MVQEGNKNEETQSVQPLVASAFLMLRMHEAPNKDLPSKTGRLSVTHQDEQSSVISSKFSTWYQFSGDSIVSSLFSGCYSP